MARNNLSMDGYEMNLSEYRLAMFDSESSQLQESEEIQAIDDARIIAEVNGECL